MGRKRSAIKADHRLGHKVRAPGQLEHRVRNTSPNTGEVDISALSGKVTRSPALLEVTPEHQPTPLCGSDLHEPAEILPVEYRTVVTRDARRKHRLAIHS